MSLSLLRLVACPLSSRVQASSVKRANVVRNPETFWRVHYLALFLLSLAAGLAFLRPPGFGDDLTYWSLAFHLHEIGRPAWTAHSHHDLRWPIWGVIWLWQCVFGSGLSSFYCFPFLCLAAGSALAFTFGRRVLGSVGGAWTCGIALLYLPLLDPVITRPMPDLSESVLGAGALLAWWAMMTAQSARRALLPGVLSGVCIGTAFSNRITGVFIAPVLAVATLLFYRGRWKWLLLPAIVSALFVVGEAAVYHSVCGDWLQSLHGNLSASAATDTHVVPLWQLPVRYVDAFFHGNRLAPVYALLAIGGIWSAWREWGVGGRLIVVWFVCLYLEYSCAVQSLHPLRPLMGSTVRYLAALSIPMALLAAFGAIKLTRVLWMASTLARRWLAPLARSPVLCGAVAVMLLSLYTGRQFFDLGFVPELRRHLAALPGGTRIFTHEAMRDVAFLSDPLDGRRLVWAAPKSIMERSAGLEAQAAWADEFWYLRKQLWMRNRKEMERKGSDAQPLLGSYLEKPERDWILSDVLSKGGDCDLVLYRRRMPDFGPPHILTAESPEFRDLLPSLPLEWNSAVHGRSVVISWAVPQSLQGKLVTLEFNAASATVEPLAVRFQFMAGRRRDAEFLFKPILYAGGGKEFVALPIPAAADACTVELHFPAKTKAVRLTGFRAVYDELRWGRK